MMVGMSGDEDIERLLAEIDGNLSGAAAKPAAGATSGAVSPTSKAAAPSERGRADTALRTGGIAAAVSGVVVFGATFFLQWLPIIDNPVSSGLGAAVGAFCTGAVLSFRGRR
jgi:hypothetical protein